MRELHQASAKALYAHFEAQHRRQHAQTLCRLIRLTGVDVLGAIRSHLFADDWMDFAHLTLTEYFKQARGDVYLAASPDHQGLVKLGKTGRGAAARMRTLNRESVLTPFELLDAVAVHDRHWVELKCHRELVGKGIPKFKEFFPADQTSLSRCIHFVSATDRALFDRQGFGLALPESLT